MLFQLILLTLTLSTSTSALFNIPQNIDFTTNLYDALNCSSANKSVTMKNMCYNTAVAENGYPNCCNDLLADVSLFTNTSFNTCLPFQIPKTLFSSISYNCSLDIIGLDKTELWAYTGLAFTALFAVIVLLGMCVYCVKCLGQNSYNTI